jgi:hypothetical protein
MFKEISKKLIGLISPRNQCRKCLWEKEIYEKKKDAE